MSSLHAVWTERPPLALLVDRDPDTRRMYGEYLEMASCQTDQAEDGREALAKAISRRPDIIVTETRLPGIDGFELCSLLRHDTATLTIPIVVVTGDAFDVDIRRARGAGANAVLIKPCLPETLLAEIHRLLDTSVELRLRVQTLREKVGKQPARSDELMVRSRANQRRVTLSRAHQRRDTEEPPLGPPPLVCPHCDRPLRYKRSHIGGVNARHPEQWDHFECVAGCGAFEYRHRTKKLRSA